MPEPAPPPVPFRPSPGKELLRIEYESHLRSGTMTSNVFRVCFLALLLSLANRFTQVFDTRVYSVAILGLAATWALGIYRRSHSLRLIASFMRQLEEEDFGPRRADSFISFNYFRETGGGILAWDIVEYAEPLMWSVIALASLYLVR